MACSENCINIVIRLQAVTSPKVCSVGVQCSILDLPTTSTPLKHFLPSDISQSESDTGLDTSEYTLSHEDASP